MKTKSLWKLHANAPQQLRPQTLTPEHQEVGQEVNNAGEQQTTVANRAPDTQVEDTEAETLEELPADQPDIHNQEQHGEDQDEMLIGEQQQHRYPTRQRQEPVRYGKYICEYLVDPLEALRGSLLLCPRLGYLELCLLQLFVVPQHYSLPVPLLDVLVLRFVA